MNRTTSRLAPVIASALLALAAPTWMNARPESAAPTRTFNFRYEVQVPPTKVSAGKLPLWLPLPQQDAYQKVSGLRVESAVIHTEGHDLEYGNPYVVFAPTAAQAAAGFTATVTFTAIRSEHRVPLDPPAKKSGTMALNDPSLKRYLEPDNLVPLNGVIADLAKEHTAGATTRLAKAQQIYDYVVSTMHYDKSGEGWGRGDAVWACTSKRGNCTDFHSLFIGMMRASGIPARFEIGFPLPAAKKEGEIPGYHCWAEFYLPGTGWVPVDASEASKDPSKKGYFFGAHDDNRVFFTYGRDLKLSAQQQGPPLNLLHLSLCGAGREAVDGAEVEVLIPGRDDDGCGGTLRALGYLFGTRDELGVEVGGDATYS